MTLQLLTCTSHKTTVILSAPLHAMSAFCLALLNRFPDNHKVSSIKLRTGQLVGLKVILHTLPAFFPFSLQLHHLCPVSSELSTVSPAQDVSLYNKYTYFNVIYYQESMQYTQNLTEECHC